MQCYKEKLDLLRLIEVNSDSVQTGVSKRDKSKIWSKIFNACKLKNHKWKIKSNAKKLSGVIWPTLRKDAVKKRTI